MAVGTQGFALESGGHVVQFYEDDAALVVAVGPYLAEATCLREVAIVIATSTHRREFETWLEVEGIDLARARGRGELLMLDAADTMARFMIAGQVDRDAFDETIGALIREVSASERPIRVYGEMVALLWDAGEVLAAIELETLWNELAGELPFSLFCSYPHASVSGSEYAEALHQVCRLHTSVLQPPDERARDTASMEVDADMSCDRTIAREVGGREVIADFSAEPESPGRARRLVVAALRQWGHELLVDDAALVLSELATNAVLHAGSPFSVVVCEQSSGLHFAVRDERPLSAGTRERGLIVRPGHGLSLVDALCTSWGVEHAAEGKVVWAELPYGPAAAG